MLTRTMSAVALAGLVACAGGSIWTGRHSNKAFRRDQRACKPIAERAVETKYPTTDPDEQIAVMKRHTQAEFDACLTERGWRKFASGRELERARRECEPIARRRVDQKHPTTNARDRVRVQNRHARGEYIECIMAWPQSRDAARPGTQ